MKNMVTTFLVFSSFSGASLATSHSDVTQKTSEAIVATVDYSKEKKEEFQKEMSVKLEKMRTEIRDLQSKASSKSGDARKQIREHIANLQAKERAMDRKLSALKKSSGRAWEHLKSGMSNAWESLSDSYEKAKSELAE